MKFLIFGLIVILSSMQVGTNAQQIGVLEVKGQVTVNSKEAEDKFYAINNNFGCILPSFDSSDKALISAKITSKLVFENILAIENNTENSINLTGYDYTIFASGKIGDELITENKIRTDKNFEPIIIPAKNLVNVSEAGENKVQSSEIKKGFSTNTAINYQVGISGNAKSAVKDEAKLKADPKIKLECQVTFNYLFIGLNVGGYSWEDINNNGLQDVGEPLIADLEIGLYDQKCQIYYKKTTTDTYGYYNFDKLEDKKYCLKVNSNYLSTKKNEENKLGSKLNSDLTVLVEKFGKEYNLGLIQNNFQAKAPAPILEICEECELAVATGKRPIKSTILPRTGGLEQYQWLGIFAIIMIFIATISNKIKLSKSKKLTVKKYD
jgi:hypothetical protein